MLRFASKLAEENTDWEEEMERGIFYLEKELKCHIDDNYPLMKFYSQMDKYIEHMKKKNEEYEKQKNSTASISRPSMPRRR